jgi:hypothetical protein
MVHFTCDLCGKDLPSSAPRFVIRIAAYAGHDPDRIRDDDLDDDHMEAISKLLQRNEETRGDDEEVPLSKGFRFDLCPDCHRRFIKDPLNRDMLRALEFSKN